MVSSNFLPSLVYRYTPSPRSIYGGVDSFKKIATPLKELFSESVEYFYVKDKNMLEQIISGVGTSMPSLAGGMYISAIGSVSPIIGSIFGAILPD